MHKNCICDKNLIIFTFLFLNIIKVVKHLEFCKRQFIKELFHVSATVIVMNKKVTERKLKQIVNKHGILKECFPCYIIVESFSWSYNMTHTHTHTHNHTWKVTYSESIKKNYIFKHVSIKHDDSFIGDC